MSGQLERCVGGGWGRRVGQVGRLLLRTFGLVQRGPFCTAVDVVKATIAVTFIVIMIVVCSFHAVSVTPRDSQDSVVCANSKVACHGRSRAGRGDNVKHGTFRTLFSRLPDMGRIA